MIAFLWIFFQLILNKNAFQYDAYRSLVDRMPESASRRVCSEGGLLGGGCLLWGFCFRGCLLLGGVCSRGVSAPGGSALGAVSALGGVSSQGGVCSGGLCMLGYQTPSVNRMTNRCKNITLATTSLRPVTRQIYNTHCCSDRLFCDNFEVILTINFSLLPLIPRVSKNSLLH